MLLNIKYLPIAVHVEKDNAIQDAEFITMWGNQLENFCRQLKVTCEAIIHIITECSASEATQYVQNYVTPDGDPTTHESKTDKKEMQKIKDTLHMYDTQISTKDRWKFNIQAHVMKYSYSDKYSKEFALGSQKSTVVRKILNRDFLKPLLNNYKDLYNIHLKCGIVHFHFAYDKYFPEITEVEEVEPSNLNERLYYF